MMKVQKEAKRNNKKKSSIQECSENTYTDILGKRSQNETSVDVLESEESSHLNTNESHLDPNDRRERR